MTVPRRPVLVAARGPRAAQDQLLRDLAQTLDPEALAPGALSMPVRVITATGALRRQLAHRISRLNHGAAVGVQVVTLWALARQVLRAAGESPRAGDSLLSLLVARRVMANTSLSSMLNPFEDGPRAATPAIRDLLSAGLASAVTVKTVLAELGRSDNHTRARALVEVAASVSETTMQLGVPRFGAQVRHAAELLRRSGPSLLPTRAVLVIGFADAPGDALSLLQALCALAPATAYLDLPNDPAATSTEDLGARFARRFATRWLPDAEWIDAPAIAGASQVALVDAAGVDAEVREIAARIRALLDDGVMAESIAVVARGLEPYALAWRRHAEALGIPFSGGDTPKGITVFERRLQSFVRVMRDGPRAGIDAWFDAGFVHGIAANNDDLRLGMRALGVSRLEEAAALDIARELGGQESLALPVRRGLMEVGEETERRVIVSRRHVKASALSATVSAVGNTLSRLQRRSESLQQHAELVRQTVAPLPQRERDAITDACDTLLALVGPEFSIQRDEFLRLLSDALTSQIDRRLGGDGGGIQLLDTARARGLSFAHLFVLGVNRDLFPGALHDDAMLDDAVRDTLRRALPDLALKSWRHDEERLLFASLMAAAPNITVSWQRADDDGKERAASAFVERLLLADEALSVDHVPRARIDQLTRWTVRTARESLQLAALSRDDVRFAALLPPALNEGYQRFAASPQQPSNTDPRALIAHVARGRIAVLGEQEPDYETSRQFGPYLGFAGAVLQSIDPRRGPQAVTTLESIARCGWQALLANFLKLECPPDPGGDLPTIGGWLVGDAAHRALQTLYERRIGDQSPTRPTDDEIRLAAHDAALAVAHENGVRLSGLIDVLSSRAAAMARNAITLEWDKGFESVVAHVEYDSSTTLTATHGNQPLRFRADRVDRVGASTRFTDYKTGKPPSPAKGEKFRSDALLKAIQAGTKLQAAIYALSQPGAVGRYLYIDPELDKGCVEYSVDHESPEAKAAIASAALLTTALQAGVLLPRLLDRNDQTPITCDHCDVRAACSQYDTGVRLRLQRTLKGQRERAGAPSLALQVWDIGAKGGGE
ncbi:MAG: PD-(D/E)XK nuclease family protein [Acidobacteriota bacterium]